MSKTQAGLVIPIIFICCSLSAQTPKYNPYFYKGIGEMADVSPFPLQKLGTMYYDDTWNAGNVILENGDSLIGYFIRFDIISNSLEIIIKRRFHTITKNQIRAFDWFSGERLDSEKYVRRDQFNLPKDEYAVDFVEMLVDGELSLIKTTAVVPRQASTSPSVVPDNAQGSDMLIIEKYFFVKNDELFEVSMRKNQNLDFIDNAEVAKYVRDKHVSFSTEGGLKIVANYYNSVYRDTMD